MPVDTMTDNNSRRNPWRTLGAVSIALCLLLRPSPSTHAAAAQDTVGDAHDADPQGGSPSEIRLGMSADFTAGSRGLGIELFRGATAYLLPVNAAGGVDGPEDIDAVTRAFAARGRAPGRANHQADLGSCRGCAGPGEAR